MNQHLKKIKEIALAGVFIKRNNKKKIINLRSISFDKKAHKHPLQAPCFLELYV
jgi:hypothetical protein